MEPVPDITCWTLIRAAAAGQAAEREEFSRRYLAPVRAYLAARWRASPILGELDDAVQEVFVACFREGGALYLVGHDERRHALRTFAIHRVQRHWATAEVFDRDPAFRLRDYLGGFAVTSVHGLKEIVEKFKKEHDDYNAIMAEALADRLAEAFAEYLHKRAREEWGYGKIEKLSTEEIIDEQYRGIRPAAGYPACPDHTEKQLLWQLLDVEKNAGIQLTESFAMWPGSSVSGLYFAHPQSKYFAVGKLGRDQLLDYHLRKGMTLQEVERWLGPYLNYDPAKVEAPAASDARCACGVAHP